MKRWVKIMFTAPSQNWNTQSLMIHLLANPRQHRVQGAIAPSTTIIVQANTKLYGKPVNRVIALTKILKNRINLQNWQMHILLLGDPEHQLISIKYSLVWPVWRNLSKAAYHVGVNARFTFRVNKVSLKNKLQTWIAYLVRILTLLELLNP